MAQFNLIQNDATDTLFVILSGISGGKDEPLVQHLFDALKTHGSVVSIQFANDPLYHDATLPEMNALSMDGYFVAIDEALKITEREKVFARIVLVAHSFSAIVATYYLAEHPPAHFTLITIDHDESDAVLAYVDSLSDEERRDNYQNPFSPETIAYLRAHNSAETRTALPVPKLHIDARDIGSDHEVTSEEAKQILVEKILAFLR